MKTSSDARVRNYERDMPRSAPDWLKEWAEEREWQENVLLFRCDWLRDPLTGMRSKAARCHCTACGEDLWLDWIHGGSCRYASAGGVRLWEDGKFTEVTEWQSCTCPECGEEVRARHIRSGGEYAVEAARPLTLHRIPEEGKRDRLALIVWNVRKWFDSDGRRHFHLHPYEAMVAEETALRRITFHGGGFGGDYWLDGPRQCRSTTDEMQAVTEIVCPEGIAKATEGTTCENAKLEIYLEEGRKNFPAAWVRLWQRRGGRAESLLTCGAGGILGNLLGQEKLVTGSYGYRTSSAYNGRFPQLKALNWKGRRPWEILRMRGKDELREAVALQERANLGGKTWEIWLAGRAEGRDWSLADAAALESFVHPERIAKTEISPVKVARYLEAQRRRWPEDKADEVMLSDYWDMAAEGHDILRDQTLMWPDRLRREHDRAVGRRKRAENAERDRKIAAVAETLERYSLTLDGITIRPARSTGELEAEGKILNHCVGSYAERVAAGETFIFFIRREEEPDMSWYTLNLDKDRRRVIQNRGRRNCDRTPEVEAFEQTWIAWVKAGARRDKAGAPVIPARNAEKTKEDAA